jgi:hypothetical protein
MSILSKWTIRVGTIATAIGAIITLMIKVIDLSSLCTEQALTKCFMTKVVMASISKPSPCADAQTHLNSALAIGTEASLSDYIVRYQNCPNVEIARDKLNQIRRVSEPQRDRIAQFIEWEYFEDREQYDDPADLFTQGVVSREIAEKTRDDFRRQFSARKFSLVPGTLIITSPKADQYVVTFSFQYTRRKVNNPNTETGSGRVRLIIRSDGERFVVSSAKDVLDERQLQPDQNQQ